MTTDNEALKLAEKMREAFIKAGYWPNKTMYHCWCHAWQVATNEAILDQGWGEFRRQLM